MNNVLNRKMFVNRNARAKLANMGGILASSPEMVDETQRFAPGGTVTVDASGATGTFDTQPQLSFFERLRQALLRKLRNNEPFNEQDLQAIETIASQDDQFRDAVIASRDQGAAMGEFGAAGVMGAIPERKQIEPIGSDSLSQAATDQMGGDNSLAGITGTEAYRLRRGDTEAEGFIDSLMPPRGNIAPERINVNSAELLDTSDNDRARRGPGRTAMDFSTETIPTASVEEKSEVEPSAGESLLDSDEFIVAPDAGYPFPIDVRNDPKYEGKSVADALTTSSNLEELDEQLEENLQEKKKEAADKLITSSPPDDGSRAGQKANADVATGVDVIYPMLSSDNLDKIADQINKSDDPSDELAKTVLDAAGEDFEGMDMPERISSYKKVLSDLLGTDTKEDKKEEFWMNMAMVGFAVAAGDDPSAIKNIADGLLAGSKMMKQDKASNQARQDKINMMALEESNKDKRLAARLRSAKTLAEIRATGTSSFATVDRLFKSVLDETLAGYKQQVEDGTISAEDAASQAIKIASESFPNSQFAIGNSGSESSEDNIPVVSTQADYDALETDTVFLQKNKKGVFEQRRK